MDSLKKQKIIKTAIAVAIYVVIILVNYAITHDSRTFTTMFASGVMIYVWDKIWKSNLKYGLY